MTRNRQTATRASHYTTVTVLFPNGETGVMEVKTTDREKAKQTALERAHNKSGKAVAVVE